MSPELQNLQDQITSLQAQFDTLKSTTTIPKEIDSAFRKRLSLKQVLGVSSKLPSTETVQAVTAINFIAQTFSTTAVPKLMDSFVSITDGVSTYTVPNYD